jgi:transcriptional regulator with XRE-family HTH domain
MNFSSPDRTRGELLRSLREAQNMPLSELARMVNLSTAQVAQLETGDLGTAERSLFYTDAIKEKAARKIAQTLGADPQMLWGGASAAAGHDEARKVLPDLQTLDDLASLLKKQSQAQEMGRGDRGFSWKWAFFLLAALWLAGALGFYGQTFLSWFQAQKASTLVGDSVVSTEVSTAPPANPAPMASPVETVPEVTALQTAAVTPDVTKSPAEALCLSNAPQSTIKPTQPSKGGGSVHVVALADLVMCVQDGAGKQTPLTLKAQESRTFWGRAPWSLRIEKPVPMHMFFQGQKFYWPEGEQSGVVFREVAGDY